MRYEVLARKWRPQTFEDVVGQEHVTQTLRNAIRADRLAHAYLFVGPRGIGKTSIARIFAKSLNCETGPTTTPCGECAACKEITAGSSLDVIEIDGASNNGVDQVRDLRDTVMYAPTRGPYKIYVIDEVHMLSTAAFNALLKTLEEPPPHVKFIFATTESHKVLPTVISRCQRFDLRRIPMNQLVERLTLISEAEGIAISPDALQAVARGAEGGLRDAESSLDQLIAFCGDTISEADVLSVFGLISHRQLESLVDAILLGNMQKILSIVSELDDAGRDLHRLLVDLMQYFRHLLIILSVGDAAVLADVSEEEMTAMQAQAQRTRAGRVLSVIDVLTDTEDRMKFALSRRSLLETALIRCGRAATIASLDEILKLITGLRQGVSTQGEAPLADAAPLAPPAPPPPASSAAQGEEPPAARKYSPATGAHAQGPDAELALLTQNWADIIERVAKRSVIARGLLLDAIPLRVEGERVVVGVDPEFADEKEQLGVGRNRIALERALSDTLGRKVVAFIEVAKADFVSPVSTGASGAADALEGSEADTTPGESETDAAPVAAKTTSAKSKSTREWSEEDAVKKTLAAFNGKIVEVRE